MFKLSNANTKVVTSLLEQPKLLSLLASQRKSVELWFLTNRDVDRYQRKSFAQEKFYENTFYQIQTNTVAILMHGLQPVTNMQSAGTETVSSPISICSLSEIATDASLQKLIDDFEWVRRSAQIRDLLSENDVNDDDESKTTALFLRQSTTTTATATATATAAAISVEQFLMAWTLRNLKANCLCSCLQALVADKELLETYYKAGSFIRNETYATALFICLSALELRQCSLLSQIEPSLYRVAFVQRIAAGHKRSSSHPNFSLSPMKKTIELTQVDGTQQKPHSNTSNLLVATPSAVVFQTFRRVKSLPALVITIEDLTKPPTVTRPRSKTMSTNITISSKPKLIPKKDFKLKLKSDLTLAIASSSSSYSGDDTQPSTSTTNRFAKSVLASSISNSETSASSSSTTHNGIELIKCDDIKIWTDQSWEQRQQLQVDQQQLSQSMPKQVTESCSIPHKIKQAKSISPINSFLTSLFSTPPSYNNWSFLNNETSSEASKPCQEIDASQSSGGVFDSFLPKYGKKLRSRKSQNLFEDGISSLDQNYYDYKLHVATDLQQDTKELAATTSSSSCKRASTNDCQSLTAFLQMSHLSRNNTQLEKENAHFRISEAIISAIEHIKWAKLEPDKWRRRNETTTAMDCLEGDQKHKSDLSKETESKYTDSDEYIPYAELGESCLDLLSAEVVGLCLISKFHERHLPKVSELKWLVSEEDTPQKLLPMPDNSSTSNPDDNILPSVTRGTKYWAPPRQQIIFTDHTKPNRHEQIQKQNNRCAGCGMRVSPQYLSSFRYCTYLGKYHCTGCHRNQISAIPAKILHFWDFNCYPVSVFAYRLLEQMYTYPLFYLPDLNPVLYTRSKQLLAARSSRLQLKFVKDFIKTCRFATIEQQYFESIPDYICVDPDTWSMSDFIDANNKSMQRYINEFILKCEKHIFNCVLCNAHGFICEHCHNEDVIYPWQHKVFRCDRCGACFHQNCWKSMMDNCCRCQRIKSRQIEISSEAMLNSY